MFGVCFGVWAGNGGPSLELRMPPDGALMTASDLKSIEGTVSDNSGTGIAWVGYTIFRPDTNLEWDGVGQWVPGPTDGWLTAKVDGSAWKASASLLPPAAKLEPGVYRITAHAADRDGNTTDVQVLITIQPQALIP
jgi:hypothetical protein